MFSILIRSNFPTIFGNFRAIIYFLHAWIDPYLFPNIYNCLIAFFSWSVLSKGEFIAPITIFAKSVTRCGFLCVHTLALQMNSYPLSTNFTTFEVWRLLSASVALAATVECTQRRRPLYKSCESYHNHANCSSIAIIIPIGKGTCSFFTIGPSQNICGLIYCA